MTTTLGGFESWSDVLADVLSNAGIEGFLGNQNAFYEQADEEAGEWEAFLTAWWARYADEPISVAKLANDIFFDRDDLRDTLPSKLVTSLDKSREVPLQGFKISLGKALAKKQGTRYGEHELHLEIAHRDERSGSPDWKVLAGVQGSQESSHPLLPRIDVDDDIPF